MKTSSIIFPHRHLAACLTFSIALWVALSVLPVPSLHAAPPPVTRSLDFPGTYNLGSKIEVRD